MVCHLGDGRWWDPERGLARTGQGRRVRRPLEIDDLQAQVGPPALSSRQRTETMTRPTTEPRNLVALCQRCHLIHDREEHRRRRWFTLFRRKALGDLFLGRYR